ncbi:DUF6046 domain-containing protein [Dysgonomonas sp. Marseille-P4361]|uniref:DUF6046 domain-containing protein n=1 Tax=Dysgonomonas sp. Marseille-P4361 TaxID=2161820 RepID=UPI000D55EF47|nr:DUF6046 domain-containing protein [Dysgonomonas sp. Marseille-P4361]
MAIQPLNPLFRRSDVILREVKELVESGQTVAMVMPFTFYLPDDSEWLLPYEPLISVQGENVIVKRNVAKSEGRGSIKERWAEGDIKIMIEGTFVNADLTKYPATEVQKLRQVITQRRAIKIKNELLSLLNVNYLVIESYSLPFSKGENVQNYSLTALSDDSYNLFIEVK